MIAHAMQILPYRQKMIKIKDFINSWNWIHINITFLWFDIKKKTSTSNKWHHLPTNAHLIMCISHYPVDLIKRTHLIIIENIAMLMCIKDSLQSNYTTHSTVLLMNPRYSILFQPRAKSCYSIMLENMGTLEEILLHQRGSKLLSCSSGFISVKYSTEVKTLFKTSEVLGFELFIMVNNEIMYPIALGHRKI